MSKNAKILDLADRIVEARKLQNQLDRESDPKWAFKIPLTKKQAQILHDRGVEFQTGPVELGGMSMGQAAELIAELIEEAEERRNAWRNQPISANQIACLRKFGAPEEMVAHLTAGEASDLIQTLANKKK